MTHQDPENLCTIVNELKEIFEQLLPAEEDYATRHGNAQLEMQWLAIVAIVCFGWTNHSTLSQRMINAIIIANSVLEMEESPTRQGVQKALKTVSKQLVPQVIDCFASYTSKISGHWSFGGKVNFAIDGTKANAPRTAANQERFSATGMSKKKKKYKKKSDASKAATVQLLVTTLWHVGTGLPYCWHVEGSSGSERNSLIAMLDVLPAIARIIGDAEYVGYPLWSEIIQSGKSFLFRVGANITLLQNLGEYKMEDGYVYFWPEGRMKKYDPPIILRLIKINEGDAAIYLVTNEFEMTDAQASELYKMRWGIEVFFRSVKESCERRKLTCRTPDNVLVELNWTLLGIWAAFAIGKKRLQSEGKPIKKLSPVQTIRAFERVVVVVSVLSSPIDSLRSALLDAMIADESQRTSSKRSREYPRKKKYKRCGKPKIKTATAFQKQQAKLHSG